MKDKKLFESLSLLGSAIGDHKKNPKNTVIFAGLSKAFEITFEYSWKYLKRAAESAGLEVYSPRDAIKAGAQLGLIDDLELWNSFINTRNLSVHDYIGLSDKQFFPLVIQFRDCIEKLIKE
jgi:nucleotidyltransferase substrate binding protein (TIGR01987 family)